MAVEYQVIILFVATRKYLLDVPVSDITRFEAELFEFLDSKYPVRLEVRMVDIPCFGKHGNHRLIHAVEIRLGLLCTSLRSL